MGKSTNFSGQPVFSQLIRLLPEAKIERIAKNIPGCDKYIKKFDSLTHLKVMLFSVLKHYDSLREIEIGMQAEAHKLRHIGINTIAHRSTLAAANKRRPQEFFAQVYAALLEQYTPFLRDSCTPKEQKEWEKLLYMMDSTTISLSTIYSRVWDATPRQERRKVE